jgi:hypothetical protein
MLMDAAKAATSADGGFSCADAGFGWVHAKYANMDATIASAPNFKFMRPPYQDQMLLTENYNYWLNARFSDAISSGIIPPRIV